MSFWTGRVEKQSFSHRRTRASYFIWLHGTLESRDESLETNRSFLTHLGEFNPHSLTWGHVSYDSTGTDFAFWN